MKNTCLPADNQVSLLKVDLFPLRAAMCISCSENRIVVLFAHEYSLAPHPEVVDITEDPERTLTCPGILIRNFARHNHIVAAYHPDDKCVVVKHKKHIYCVMMPCEVKMIYCGGNIYNF